MKGLVSVIVPVYNRGNLVSETIDSILSQTYKNFEIILINDGSSDDSLSILAAYERRFPEKIRVIDQKNQGQIIARNNGIKVARGQYIAFLDSDDLWKKDKLERQLPLFQQGVGLVYTGTEIINEKGETVRLEPADEALVGDIYGQLLVKNRMTGGTVVVTAEALEKVGVFSQDFKAAENWDLWLRICKEYSADVVADPLIEYRVHSNNMSSDGQLMLDAKMKIIEKHCDLKSSDPLISRFSKLAYADYFYRVGLDHFANERYLKASKAFIKTMQHSFTYMDARERLLRSLAGPYINRMLRAIKYGKNKHS